MTSLAKLAAWTTRVASVAAFVAALAAPGEAAAQNRRVDIDAIKPMSFRLVEGAPDACGPGCSRWIAAEGAMLAGAASTFAAFVRDLGPARPPVILDSDGGLLDVAQALGRVIRRAGLAVAVGRTVGVGLDARVDPAGACHGSCLYALAGGVSRSARPGAAISISAIDFQFAAGGALPEPRRQKLIAATLERVRSYFVEMGVDPSLADRLDGTTTPGFIPDRAALERYRLVTADQRT